MGVETRMSPDHGTRVTASSQPGAVNDNPAVLQRRLRSAIRRFRQDAGLTQKQVAAALEWSESKIMRIETGATNISATDLRALLAQYDVTDTDKINELAALARESRKLARGASYRQEFDQQFYLFLGYEASAVRIRLHQSTVVPTILQTEDYSRHIARTFHADEHKIQRVLDVRADRQRLLDEPAGARTVEILLDESVLRRKVGTWAVMRDQVLRIKEIAELPNVTIRVVPFHAGEHWGMAASFDILDLSPEPHDRLVFVEHPSTDAVGDVTLVDSPDDMTPYVEGYLQAAKVAATPAETVDILDTFAARYADRA